MYRGKQLASLCTLIAIFFLSTVVPSYAYSSPAATAQGTLTVLSASVAPETREFVVYIGRTGFNGSADSFKIVVNEGDIVHIRFVYADTDLGYDNPHQIMIEGYGITTEKINRANPEQTVEFVAGQSGDFLIHCILICNGHTNLQTGTLSVTFAAGTALPTRMTVSLEQTVGEEKGVSVAATLIDAREEPVVGAVVQFYVNTTFGPMKIGSSTTDATGKASITYNPGGPGQLQFTVVYAGAAKYEPSTTAGSVIYQARGMAERGDEFPFVLGQNMSPDIRLVGSPWSISLLIVTIVGLVVGGVWATYLFVAKQLVDIRKFGGLNGAKRLATVPLYTPFSPAKTLLFTGMLVGLGVLDSLTLDFLQLPLMLKVPFLVVVVVAEVFLFIQFTKKLERLAHE